MARVNDIIKYGIQDEVNAMLDADMSTYKIAEAISNNHKDIPALANASHMKVQRYKEWRDMNKLVKVDESGENMLTVLQEEFRDTNKKILKDLKKWNKKADELYDKAKEDGSYSDQARIMQQATKTIMDQMKVSESKMNYLSRQMKNVGEINQKKVQNLNIIMISMANKLCPECRKQILEELSRMV